MANNAVTCCEHAGTFKKRSRLRRVRCAQRVFDKTCKVGPAMSKNEQDLGMPDDVSVE